MQEPLILLNDITNYERVELPKVTRHHVCNPSIIIENGQILCSYRGVNYDLRRGSYKPRYCGEIVKYSDTQNYIAHLDIDLNVKKVLLLEDRHIRAHDLALMGVQDLRLFHWQGRVFALGAAAGLAASTNGCESFKTFTMALAEVQGSFLQFHGFLPRRQIHEKNWMPWVRNGELNFVYIGNPCEIVRLSGDGQLETVRMHPKSEGDLFGSSCVIRVMERYVGIFHRKQISRVADIKSGRMNVRFRYSHIAIIFDDDLSILDVSREFSFEGQDVEFCSGLAFHDQKIILSYGIWDNHAVILRVGALEFFKLIGIFKSFL